MKKRPVIIAVAISGSVPKKVDNPALPVTPPEQIEAAHAAFEAGASLLHLHVRNDDETPSSSPEKFSIVQEGVKKHCPGMIIQFSTGGRGRAPSQRGGSLYLSPDMGSLSTGSVNFPNIVYENHPMLAGELAKSMKEYGVRPEIEIFDLSHLHTARAFADKGLLPEDPHIQFVMGVRNAMPAKERLLDILLTEARCLFPDMTWAAAGVGRFQSPVMSWALSRDCDGVRTGFEDNIRVTKTQLADSNAALVQIAADMLDNFNARPARVEEARSILKIDPFNSLPEFDE